MSVESKEVESKILTWPLPTGVAASIEASRGARMNHYLATTTTLLADGTSVLPTQETLEAILDGWDYFGIEVVICSDSYIERV